MKHIYVIILLIAVLLGVFAAKAQNSTPNDDYQSVQDFDKITSQAPYKASVGGIIPYTSLASGPSFKLFFTEDVAFQADIFVKGVLTAGIDAYYNKLSFVPYISIDMPFSNLKHFSDNNPDTAGMYQFMQAYSELYDATFDITKQLPFSVENLESMILNDTAYVNIGILHYRFNEIDTLIAQQKLYLDNDSILHENDQITSSLYRERSVLMITPLTDYLKSNNVTLLDKITLIPNPTTGELRIENGELRIEN